MRKRLRIGERCEVELDLVRYPGRTPYAVFLIPFGGSVSVSAPVPDEEKAADREELRAALERDPGDHLARFTLANCLRMDGFPDGARAEYRRVAESGDGDHAYCARQMLEKEAREGWDDVGPSVTWRTVWYFGFRPLFLRRRAAGQGGEGE